MRLTVALWTLVAVIFAANWTGWGHNYLGILLLAGFFHLARALPERGWRWLVGILLAASVLIASLAIVQMWHMDRARGPFLSPNLLGFYAVVMLFLGLPATALCVRTTSGRGGKLPGSGFASFAIPAANLISLALSQSRASLIALAAGLAVCTLPRYKSVCVGIATVAALIAASIRAGSEQGRMDIWRAGWQAFLHRPLTGWGEGGVWVGGLKAFYSIPLDLMVSAGLLGLLAGMWLFVEAWRCAGLRCFLDELPPLSPVKARYRLAPGAWSTSSATRALLAAWLINGLFIYGAPATFVPIFLVLGRLSRQQEERHPTRDAQRRRDGADEAKALRFDAPA